MIIGGMFNQNDILGAAMQTAVLRDRIHAHNLANNDTPGFKRFEVFFEDNLQRAVDNYRATGRLNLSRVNPEVRQVRMNLRSRIDGNNVDINEENVMLFRNSVIFDALAGSVIANYRQLTTVFNNMRGS